MNREVHRGEIYYFTHSKYYNTDPDIPAGRPGIIVSSDELNKHSEMVEVVYLTTKEKKTMPTHAEVLCKIPSTALCETIYTVNKDRLGDFVRCLTDEEMEAVNAGMLASLGLTLPVEVEREVEDSTSAVVERNLYKTLYEQLLDRLTVR